MPVDSACTPSPPIGGLWHSRFASSGSSVTTILPWTCRSAWSAVASWIWSMGNLAAIGIVICPAAIASTCTAFATAFIKHDADHLAGLYAPDADWVNAFGSVKKGSDEIVAYLRGLFADANFAAGRSPEPPQASLRRVTDDVVILSIRQQIYGQGRVGDSAT